MNECVLVVDDDPTNLKLAVEVLAAAGFATLRARTGDEALTLARTAAPQLIVLDLRLPDRAGLEILQTLKAEPATRSIRVVVVSAYAMSSDIQRAQAAGCDGYITKPIDVEVFPAQIAGYLRNNAELSPGGPS